MSKQYLALHTIDEAHPSDIFSVAPTPTQLLSASGSPNILIHSTTDPDFPIAQCLTNAHPTGCHHLTASRDGLRFVSVGFAGDAKIWNFKGGMWVLQGVVEDPKDANAKAEKKEKGDLWAVCLSEPDGQYLAGTRGDGSVVVWDITPGEEVRVVRRYEGRGRFGVCVDLSPDGKLLATATDAGTPYIFSTESTRLLHGLPGLIKPIRALAFSPGSKILAAAGDSKVISLYDPRSGEQVANLQGHAGWITSLDWSDSGQYLLSGSLDGKVKVWDIELRKCVATHSEGEGKGLWSVKWLPRGETSVERGKGERFVTAGVGRGIAIYREASGG